MSDRGVSTVLDVALCLVLVSAAVLTVAGVHAPRPDPAARAAGETAAALASTTATVNYSLSGAAETADAEFPRTDGQGFERTAHGTLGSLLAEAALANLSLDAHRVTDTGGAFAAAVRDAIAPLLVGTGWRGQVVARWTPYEGSDLRGAVRAGAEPPPDADVHTATLSVPSGMAATRSVDRLARLGYVGLARGMARGVVRERFPPAETRQALAGAYPRPRLTVLRYEGFADAYGVDMGAQVAVDAAGAANDRLVAAMADALADDMRDRFESPHGAAETAAFGTVTVVVRTWSP